MIIMTYNLQTGLGIDGVRDISRAGRLVAELGADIAGLQEVEVGNPRSRLVNQPARLAESSEMHVGFAHGFQRATWRFGNCLLSRWPIVRCDRAPLPSMKETRSALVAQVDRDGLSLNVVCTHLGLNRDERVGQCKVLREVLDGLDGPTVLLGDFNDFPGAPPLQMLMEIPGLDDLTTGDPTFMAPNPTVKIDYIFGLHVRAQGPSRVVSSVFSDHLPLIVEAEVVE